MNFPTPPPDDTGLPHIIEHCVLAGSEKFPVREPFFEMIKMSMATFINAIVTIAKIVPILVFILALVFAFNYAQFADTDDLRDNLMFRAPRFRHHVAPDETATDMIERAAADLDEPLPPLE